MVVPDQMASTLVLGLIVIVLWRGILSVLTKIPSPAFFIIVIFIGVVLGLIASAAPDEKYEKIVGKDEKPR